jgi:hypothetical protein
MPSKIIPIQGVNTPTAPEVSLTLPDDTNDKHLAMLEVLGSAQRKSTQKNVTQIVLNQHQVTRRSRVALVIAPEWGRLHCALQCG